MTIISKDEFQGLTRITVENEKIRFAILPQVGGKMISLVLKDTDREYISVSDRGFKRPAYETNYADLDVSGFDECFPAIAEGFYPEWPWKGTVIPDHGEIFTLPWDIEIKKDRLIMTVYGVRFPYRFVKVMSLEKNTVKISYELENLSPCEFKYIWSAHPLFAVNEGTKILLPGTPNIRTDFSKYERFGKHLYETIWPHARQADGQNVDLSIIRSAKEDAATKVFTTKLDEGFCGFEDTKTGDFLTMTFPVDKVPYVGIWINEGGFFKGKGSFNVAIEPCTGCPDKLETAIQRGEHALIKGGATNTWSLDITVGQK
jgi:hypothetical protein